MTPFLSFRVLGIPQPKGSTKAFAFRRRSGKLGVAVTSANAQLKPWEARVRDALTVYAQGVWFDGPVAVDIVFALPRPKSLPKRVTDHLKKPDLDKLIRGTLDALTGRVFTDDAQVTRITARKVYADPEPHAVIRVTVDA